jgi:ATP-dependent DNA ligase
LSDSFSCRPSVAGVLAHQCNTTAGCIAFDLLQVRGRDLRARPLTDRQRVLEDLVDGSDVLPVRRGACQ